TEHLKSTSSEESPRQSHGGETADALSARLQDIQTSDPERFAEIQRLLDTTDREVPSNLRKVMREQLKAILLDEASRLDEPPERDHVQLANGPSRNATVRNPRLLAAVPETGRPLSSDSGSATGQPTQASEPEVAAVQPAGYSQPVQPAPQPVGDVREPVKSRESEPQPVGDVREPVKRADSEPQAPAETDNLTLGQWQKHLKVTTNTLEKELVSYDLEEDQAARWNTYLRLLHVISNHRDQAIEPIEGLTEDEREYWKHLLYSLLVSLDADDMHASSRRATLALRDLRAASDHLSNISTLDVKGLTFCPQVYSFGRVVEYDSHTFSPDQEVLLYVEVDNFAVEQKGDQYETHLTAEYSLFDSRGVRVANVALPSDKQLCNNRRRDYFIAYPLSLPGDIPPGSYTLQLTIEDVIGKKSNLATIDFRIR
ncbi:MAG: hypothetical protein ACC628_09560, partial [Pirellulaceae bacterium]